MQESLSSACGQFTETAVLQHWKFCRLSAGLGDGRELRNVGVSSHFVFSMQRYSDN